MSKKKRMRKVLKVENPTEKQIEILLPGLAAMKKELEALGCKVTMKIGKLEIKVEE